MPDFTVARRGTDSSGRGIYSSAFMWAWWESVVAQLGFRPTITQGAHMLRNGGGAEASAGYHDLGGAFDLRVWDLTGDQVRLTIRTLRANGAAAWLRNPQHGGFDDPHIHFVLGTDKPLASGAAYQWRDYINGGDGMGGSDYHPRPHPLITKPPEDEMQEADFDRIQKMLDAKVDEIAKATAKAVLNSDVVSKLDVSVREALRAAFNESQGKRK